MSKNIFWTVAKYLLAIGVLSYVVYANWRPESGRGLGHVWQDHIVEGRPIRADILLLAFAMHILGLMAAMLRWYILVRAQDIPFSKFDAIRIGTLGMLFNAFLPGSVGGDVIRAAALARGQSRQTIAVATVVMDRFLSLWGIILLVAAAGLGFWSFGVLSENSLAASRAVIVTTASIVGVSLAVWIGMGMIRTTSADAFAVRLNGIPKIGGSLAELWQAVWLYRSQPMGVAWAIVLSVSSTMLEAVAFYCYVLALWDGDATNPLPSLAEHFLLVPVGLVISAVPLFPGGTGIGEAGFGGLYVVFHSEAANGVLGSLLFRVSGWMIGVVGYLLCQMVGPTQNPAEMPENSAPSPTEKGLG